MLSIFRRLYTRARLRWRRSDTVYRLSFYGEYFKSPVLLFLATILAAWLLTEAALPFAGYVAGEADYFMARIDLARGRDQEALASVRAALLHTRENADFWQLSVEIAEKINSDEAPYCWQQLDRLRPGSLHTQISWATSALRYHPARFGCGRVA